LKHDCQQKKPMPERTGRKTADPLPGQLISGLIYSSAISLEQVYRDLENLFGRIDIASSSQPFSWTTYYQKEMGQGLIRIFLAFECLVPQDFLAEAKHRAIGLEEKWKESGRRKVNIDPGILTAERLVLATTKNFTHRIYLSRGIFADLTLIYGKGGFAPLPWTYPDYREPWSLEFWKTVRQGYMERIRDMKNAVPDGGTDA